MCFNFCHLLRQNDQKVINNIFSRFIVEGIILQAIFSVYARLSIGWNLKKDNFPLSLSFRNLLLSIHHSAPFFFIPFQTAVDKGTKECDDCDAQSEAFNVKRLR